MSTSGLAWPTRLRRRWTRARAWVLAYLPDRSRVFRPTVRITTSPSIPSLLLRLVVVAIGLLCAATVVGGPPGWVVVVGLSVAILVVPGSMVPGALVGVLGLLMVFDIQTPAVWRAPFLIAAAPLMLQLAAVAGQASATARIELRVLALPLRRYLVIQLFAQTLALVGAVSAGLGLVQPQAMAVAGAALLVLVLVWLPSLGASRRPQG